MFDVKIKICGLTNYAVVEYALAAGADYLGIVFEPKSKRYVNPDMAAELLRDWYLDKVVAVFMNQSIEEIKTIINKLNIKTVQLHGKSKLQHAQLPQDIRRIIAIAVDSETINLTAEERLIIQGLDKDRDFILFDNKNPGSGQTFVWDKFTNPFDLRFFIAGGINASNALLAIKSFNPYGLDISSGVEKFPGIKCETLIDELLDTIRLA